MKKSFVLLLAMICVSGAIAQTTLPTEVANTSTFKAGDTLTYHFYNSIEDAKVGNNKKFGVPMAAKELRENGDIYFHVNNNPNNFRVFDKNGNMLLSKTPNRDEVKFQHVKPILKYPLRIGDTWENEVVHDPFESDKDRKVFNCKGTSQVIGWETITVPAGTFTALRIDVNETCIILPARYQAKNERKYWISPEAKMHPVLYQFKQTWQGGSAESISSLTSFNF